MITAPTAPDAVPAVRVRPKRWVAIPVIALASLYPLALVALVAGLRLVGERWWVTSVALYLPRVAFLAPLPVLLIALFLVGARRAFWLLIVSSLPIFLVLMGFVFPWPTRMDRGAPVVRVLSFNIDSGAGGLARIFAEVDKYSPDIVLVQELGPQEKKAAALFETRYPTVRYATQFLVATRFPITSSREPETLSYEGHPRSPRWTQQVIETPLGPIAFYNVHPISPREALNALRGNGLKNEMLEGRGFSGESKELVKSNTGLRVLQIDDFARAAAGETLPVVIAGDTNSPVLSYQLSHDLARYHDGFEKAGWGFGYTFPTTRGPWMRIDRMFASDALRFVRFQVGRSTVSDHDCIIGDLQRAQ
jgi:endonuclease/exonuclease/phosphatase (EEP) superfamily protein YafD